MGWLLITYTVLYISQVSVFPLLPLGNFSVEVFIEFISAMSFVVKPHLDRVFSDLLTIRWIQPLLLFMAGLVAMVTLHLKFIASGIC